MAAHDPWQESTALSTLLRVLRRRWWIALLCVILVPGAALVLSMRQANSYEASSEVLLSRQNLGAMLTNTTDPSFLGNDQERYTATQAALAHGPVVAAAALRTAGVAGLTPEALLGKTSVSARGGTDILEFKVVDGDPTRAALLATSFAEAYVAYRGRLDGRALERARAEVKRTLARLRTAGRGDSDLYTSLEEKEQQLATLQTLQTSQATVTTRADGAVRVSPRPKRNLALGLVLGVGLALALAFGIEALDTRVRSAAELSERLGLTLLARIPLAPRRGGRRSELPSVADPTGRMAESFRMLQTNLEFAALTTQQTRVILVTSALPSEGRSTTAANLAVTEARAGKKVALVDLDLRNPSIMRLFELADAPGVSDVVLGDVETTAALARIDLAQGRPARGTTEQDRGEGTLAVLPAGSRLGDAGDFVSAQRLAIVLNELRLSHDLVLVDTPPLFSVGDALRLSSVADAIVVVTRANVVRRAQLAELRRLLERAPVTKLGVVVTGASSDDTIDYVPANDVLRGGLGNGLDARANGSHGVSAGGAEHAQDRDDRG